MWETISAMRDLARLHEITSVLIRHGLGGLVQRIGIGTILEGAGRILHWGEEVEASHLEPAERIRLAMEELGPTFIKLGQLMSTREDVFPPNWVTEFEKLQSSVPPVPFDDILPEMERALKRSPFEVFRDLNTTPCASASIAQVYEAKLQDGTPVVLKIRRPGIQSKIDADLRILTHIAHLIETEIPEAKRYQPVELVAEFNRSLNRELDLAIEARNIDRFARNFAGDPAILIPKVYWEWTSEIMNVQEHVVGIRGNDLQGIDAAGLDRKVLAARGADAVLKMILIDGFFHADPHPGNVFYREGNRIVMIDFGMVGRLSPVRRNQIVDLLAGIVRMDEGAMLDVLLDWSGDALVDEEKLSADVNDLLTTYENVQLKDLKIGKLVREFTAIIREHSIVLPSDLAMMFKALITLEGLGRQYDPTFHLAEHITPFLKRVIADRNRPSEILKRGRANLRDVVHLVSSVPRDVAALFRDARRGKVRMDLDLKRLDHFGYQIDRSSNRLTIGILTASLVIGSSIVMTVPGGPKILGLPVLTIFGLLGYLIAFLNSLWIIFSIWRSRREP